METSEEKSLTRESDQGFSRQFYQVEASSEIVVEEPVIGQEGQNLFAQIPKTTVEGLAEDSVTINMPISSIQTPKKVSFSPLPSPSQAKVFGSPGPSSSLGNSDVKNFLPKLSFKFRNSSSETEKAAMLMLGASPDTRGKPSITRAFSLTKIFTPKMKRTSSLPTSPVLHSNPESVHGGIRNFVVDEAKGGSLLSIHRSRSVPVLNKHGSTKQLDYLDSVFRVIPSTPHVPEQTSATATASSTFDPDANKNYSEDIPQEEAVCRICLVELGEGTDTMKMECSCKGELAIAHQECAIKWFSIKGNKTCEVCKQEVQNLPVTLLRIQNIQSRGSATRPNEISRYRVWQDVPVLVIVSMLAYFCFLEQLLVNKMESSAIAISLPFASILGLLASMISTTMVRRRYSWMYATGQFALVVIFSHFFYSLLGVQAVLSVLLATVVGFGGAMCGTYILFEILKRRRNRNSLSNSQRDSAPENHSSDAGDMAQMDTQQNGAVNQGNNLGS
ncbi:uncharacterized protein LOC142551789 isoform X1 [Primulina tabacum]|uniref:uncharacterized protein LOC142551789 isoform X1 n=1 Tax=Primulina tabacum TaxID=48773 RepID=UPI003F596F6F